MLFVCLGVTIQSVSAQVATGTITGTIISEEVMDVNCDSKVDIFDVISLLNYVGYPRQYSLCNNYAGDITGDNVIDTSDVIRLLYYVNSSHEHYELE